MQCDRAKCEEILCHHCILNNTRYICGSCLCELQELWQQRTQQEMTELEVENFIEDFFNTEKGNVKFLSHDEADEVFKNLTKTIETRY